MQSVRRHELYCTLFEAMFLLLFTARYREIKAGAELESMLNEDYTSYTAHP
jgi:hypothetical protein